MSTVIAWAIGDCLDFEVFKQMIIDNTRTQQGQWTQQEVRGD